MATKQELTFEQVAAWIRTQDDYEQLIHLNREVLVPHIRYVSSNNSRDVLSAIAAGDVIIVRWTDGTNYPLVVSKTPTRASKKNVQCTYVYENGTVEHWNVSGSMVQDIISLDPRTFKREEFLNTLALQLENSKLECEVPESGNFFLNTIEAGLNKRG